MCAARARETGARKGLIGVRRPPARIRGVAPPQALSAYRCVDAGAPTTPCFGVNACHEDVGGVVQVGDEVEVVRTGVLQR